MIVLAAIAFGLVFAVKEMWAAMILCLLIAFVVQILASMSD